MQFGQLLLHLLLPCVIAVQLLPPATSTANAESIGLAVPTVGTPFKARLLKIDRLWRLTLDGNGDERIVAAADLVRWGRFREDDTSSRIVFRDGSVVVGSVSRIDDGSITFESAAWPSTEIARATVAALVFSPPASDDARDELLRTIKSHSQAKDIVLLRNADRIAGRLTSPPGGVPPDDLFGLRGLSVAIRTDTLPVTIAVDDAIAVLLGSVQGAASVASPDGTMWLGFADGSLLAVSSIDADSPDVRLTLSCGQSLTLPSESMLREIFASCNHWAVRRDTFLT